MLAWPVCARMVGPTCFQLAMRAVSLICSVDVKPNPPSLMEVNSRMLSCGVSVVLSQELSRFTVMVSRVLAVVVSKPMARAVKFASPAVTVRQRAWATCVVRP